MIGSWERVLVLAPHTDDGEFGCGGTMARLVDAGTEVTWVNYDTVPHNAVADDGAFETDLLNKDGSGSVVMDAAGTHAYKCTIHPAMTATITVR